MEEISFTDEELQNYVNHHNRLREVEVAYQSSRGADAANDHFVKTQTKLMNAFSELIRLRELTNELEST